MKLADIFKKLGINLEDEIEESSTETSKLENKDLKNDNVETKNNNDNKDNIIVKETEAVKVEDKKMVLPKYDEKTGLFTGLNEVDNEDLKVLLKSVNNSVKTRTNNEKINKAISDKVNSLKLIDGITSDVVIKMLDTTGIKIQDDEVVGIDEAFDNLVKSQAGLFKANKETDKPSPMLEGFSKPMDKNSPFSEEDIINLAYGQE